jgi:hypothetical protein
MASSKYLTITAIAAVLAVTPFLTAKHASATPCAFTDVSLTIGGTTYLPTNRGRDARYRTPPAQIPASPIRALGSYLGYLTAKRTSGQG